MDLPAFNGSGKGIHAHGCASYIDITE